MAAIVLLVIATLSVFAKGQIIPDIEGLKNDYVIKNSAANGQRIAGWTVLGPKNLKCDMVRRSIKTFGYCWQDENEKKGINTGKERSWVREVIRQWEKCGGIKLVEEAKCRRGPDFVTVMVGNYGPKLIPDIDERTCKISGFDMLLDFYTFGINIESYKVTEKVRKSNIQMYALHEFGHFLGFDHEHNRKDRQECYYQIDESEVGPNAYYGNYHISGAYDLESIMNYCRPNVHYKPWLSELDKRGVWEVYGGGNWQECDAVTKPWQWYKGDGLDDVTLQQMQKEANGK